MGLTLDELKFIKIQLIRSNRQEDERREALELILREIKLKELEKTIPGSDISGHSMEGGD